MAGYEINVGSELLPGLLIGPNGLAKLVETVLNQILEAQITESVGAQRHERSEERQGYRNDYRARTLYTRVGPVTLHHHTKQCDHHSDKDDESAISTDDIRHHIEETDMSLRRKKLTCERLVTAFKQVGC